MIDWLCVGRGETVEEYLPIAEQEWKKREADADPRRLRFFNEHDCYWFPDNTRGGIFILPERSRPNHALITKQLLLMLMDVTDKTKFEVNYDNSFVLERTDPASMPRPDVFVMDRTRFRTAAAEDRYPERSPELAIEVVSPSNTKRKLSEKRDLYLANGSLAVWVVYPNTRTVVVWEASGKMSEFQEGDTLSLPTAISDRAIQVCEIFSVLA